jgi:acyl-CoA synthetase (AMP-forming)/AMP-acid ligase II
MHGGRVDPVRGMTGILCPSIEARILREDGSEADYNEIGELILRGPTIALGYWNNEKATKETFKDGWLHTGDRFYVDKQGRFLYVHYLCSSVTVLRQCILWSYVDRAKVGKHTWEISCNLIMIDCHQDTFKVSGKQVSPSEIEKTLREHPSQLVVDVAVAGVKGERLSGELVPRAWVVLSSIGKERGVEAALASLDEWARSRLSKHKWLRGGLQAVDEVSDLYVGKSIT